MTDVPETNAAANADAVESAVTTGTDRIGEPCGNCGAILLGPHCHACGQPVDGLVRHFSSVAGDLLDTVLQLDTRITRTLTPLLLRPGFLTREYFVGRRVRYVSPVRLFFFLSVVAFLLAQWTIDSQPHLQSDHGLQNAATIADAQRMRDDAVRNIEVQKKKNGLGLASEALAEAEKQIRDTGDKRIAELRTAQARHQPPPTHGALQFDDNEWDAISHPLQISWLPAFANRGLNWMIGRAQGNVLRIQQDPNLLLDAWMSALPSTLFLLLPIFALLLKIAYFLKRRLYMEHFIVALHSHAFLCLNLLLILLFYGFNEVIGWSWAHVLVRIAVVLLIAWTPIYLWLMQKRVYAQGWLMTSLKFSVLGLVYMVLLSIGAALSLMFKLVWL